MRRLALAFAILWFSSYSFAQSGPAPGMPMYGSFDKQGLATVDLQNLNVDALFPISASPGRGLNMNFLLSYNSSFWTPKAGFWYPVMNQQGTFQWGWNDNSFMGTLDYKATIHKCTSTTFYAIYSDFTYTDPIGTVHPFNVYVEVAGGCGTTSGSKTGYATDGSGYFLDSSWESVQSPSGVTISPNVQEKDTNGNYISQKTNSQNSSEADFYDTQGNIILKFINTTPNYEWNFDSLTSAGSYNTGSLYFTSYDIQTNFGCSGIPEYSLSSVYLPSKISLPNGQSYTIIYETTPGYSYPYTTGRIQQIDLPDGGDIQFNYTGPNDGINCSDGSTNGLQIVENAGSANYTTQYSRSNSSGNWETTVTEPKMPYDSTSNQAVVTFNSNDQEISRQIYQGSASSGNLLRTMNTTWAANGTPATKTTILENRTTQNEVETAFDSYGNLQVLKEHDWGSGAPGPVLRTTNLTYLSNSSYTNLNILDRVTEETVADSSGTIRYREDIAYDNGSSDNTPCISGAPQHDDTNYGCSFTTRGNPTSITTYTDPASPSGGITKNFTYDSLGNLRTAQVDCCQQKQWNYSAATEYSYPDSVVSGPSGGAQLTTSYVYNPDGSVASTTGPNGHLTSYTYDTMGRILTVTRPDNAEMKYTYNDSADNVAVSMPVEGTSSIVKTTYYDGLGRTTEEKVSDSSGTTYSIVSTNYDPSNRPYQVSNPYTGTAQYFTTTQFDALGRPRSVTLPDGSTTTYSYSGAAATVTDPTGKQRESVVDGLGRLATVYEPDVNNGNLLTVQTSYVYTALDDVATVTEGAQTRTYSYDGLGRLTSVSTPEAGTVSYQYNDFGLVTQRTDARLVVTNYSYDSLNRLTSLSYTVPQGSGVTPMPNVCNPLGGTANANVCFYYDEGGAAANALGRLTHFADDVGSEAYTYNILGRTTQVQKVIHSQTYTTGYAYNLAGELTSITYPSGRVVQQSFDAIGRLCEVAPQTAVCGDSSAPYASGYAYSPALELTGLNYGNGVAASFGYSPDRLQLTSLSYTKGTNTLFSLSYSYAQNGGNDGEITSITDGVDSGRNVSYTYDALGRLSTAVTAGSSAYPKWGLQWTYDRYGNRLSQAATAGSPPQNSVTVNSSTNCLTGTGYSCDASGNMTGDGINTLTYDAENRTSTVNGPYGGATYTYDGNGLRVEKQVTGGTTTVYIFSGSKVIAEYDNGAAPSLPSREYIYSGSSLLAKIASGATTYYHSDHLSTRLLTDSSGNVVGQQGHYPFGESWYTSNTTTNWAFTTYERDAESQNDYAMARYDANRQGRFTTPDPLGGSAGDPQSLNRYSYVANDPVNNVDPSGLVRTPWGFGFSGVDFGSDWNEFEMLDVFLGYQRVPGQSTGSGPSESVNQQGEYVISLETDQQQLWEPVYGWVDISSTQEGIPIPNIPSTLSFGPLPSSLAPKPFQLPKPCPPSGTAPPPSTYQSVGLTDRLVTEFGTLGRLGTVGDLYQFHRGGLMDAQASGGSIAYGNYVYGVYMGAAGYSLSFSLSGANMYAWESGATAVYKAKHFTPDPVYKHNTATNVANITNGYNDEKNGTLCIPGPG